MSKPLFHLVGASVFSLCLGSSGKIKNRCKTQRGKTKLLFKIVYLCGINAQCIQVKHPLVVPDELEHKGCFTSAQQMITIFPSDTQI